MKDDLLAEAICCRGLFYTLPFVISCKLDVWEKLPINTLSRLVDLTKRFIENNL